VRHQAAREGLADCKGNDVLLFASHGYPDEMAGCFRAGRPARVAGGHGAGNS